MFPNLYFTNQNRHQFIKIFLYYLQAKDKQSRTTTGSKNDQKFHKSLTLHISSIHKCHKPDGIMTQETLPYLLIYLIKLIYLLHFPSSKGKTQIYIQSPSFIIVVSVDNFLFYRRFTMMICFTLVLVII